MHDSKNAPESRSRKVFFCVNLFGALFATLYCSLVFLPEWKGRALLVLLILLNAFYLLLLYFSRSFSLGGILFPVLFWAVLFRLIVALDPYGGGHLLSNDLWRYMWEGKVVESGENPYVHSPDDPSLSELKGTNLELWKRVEHKKLSSIYPPFAQGLFSIMPSSVRAYRLSMAVVDVLSIVVICAFLKAFSRAPGAVIAYAWCPLAVIEVSSGCHLEGFAVLSMLVGIYFVQVRPIRAWAFASVFLLSCSVLIKFLSLIPLVLTFGEIAARRARRELLFSLLLFAVIVSLGYLPFVAHSGAVFGSLFTFVKRWEFNGSFYAILRYGLERMIYWETADVIIRSLVAIFLFLYLLSLIYGRESPVDGSSKFFFALVLCSSLVYPWYLLWFLPLIVIGNPGRFAPAMFVFVSTVSISYEVLSHPADWSLPMEVWLAEYLPVYAVLFWCWGKRRRA